MLSERGIALQVEINLLVQPLAAIPALKDIIPSLLIQLQLSFPTLSLAQMEHWQVLADLPLSHLCG